MNSADLNQAVVSAARSWIGTPYHHQQSAKGHGVDCLGLVRGVWREVVGPEVEHIPTYGSSWKTGGDDMLLAGLDKHMTKLPQIPTLGCVLAFRYRQRLPVHHLAIATGQNTMVHAYHRTKVLEVEITPFWLRKLSGCYGYPMRGAD